MLLRGQQVSGKRLFVDVVCCLCGVGILILAIYLWSGYHFSPGPGHFRPGAPDPSIHARWLFIVGLSITGYFGFSGASTFARTDTDADTPEAKKHLTKR